MNTDYNGPAVLRPDLIEKANAKRTRELVDALKMALVAIDALIEARPVLTVSKSARRPKSDVSFGTRFARV